MQNIKLLKEPGYITDLNYIFFFHFNKEYCLAHHINDNDVEKEKAHYEQISNLFGAIPDDLYVFFHALDNGIGFFGLNYINKYQSHFTSDYNLSLVQKELSNHSKVIERLIRFYFPDLHKVDAAALVNSRERLFDFVKISDYSDTEKSRLYEFFMSPASYIQKLQYELMKKDVLLTAYYEKNYSRILETYNGLSYEIIFEQLKSLDINNPLTNAQEELYLSFCLINKNYVNFCPVGNGFVCLFGYDYVARIDFLQNRQTKFKLDDIGSALSEASRVQILDIMQERGEINCKELEKIFNFSGSTAYHHLSLMLKYGVIKTRNIGKTIYYSVNEACFENLIQYLKKYTNRK